MQISFTSLLTATLFSSILIALLCLIYSRIKYMVQIGINCLLICIFLITLRFFIPFEFPFTKNVPVTVVFPFIMRILRFPLISVPGVIHITILSAIFIAWLIGSLYYLVTLSRNYYTFYRSLKMLDVTADPDHDIVRALNRVVESYGKKNIFRIVITKERCSPMIFGFARPYIIIPNCVHLTEDEWYYILHHEVAHFYHGDLFTKMLVQLLCIIYWWNPLIPRFREQFSLALEIHIDKIAIKHTGDMFEYERCFLSVAKDLYTNVPENEADHSLSSPLCFNNEPLPLFSQRFHIVTNDVTKKYKPNRILQALLIGFAVFITVLSYSIIFESYHIPDEVQEETFSLKDDEVYLVMNSDGGYELYNNDAHISTLLELDDSFSSLPVYNSLKEVPNHE